MTKVKIPKKILFVILGGALLLIGFALGQGFSPKETTSEPTPTIETSPVEEQTFTVTRVIDGDTIEVEGGERVRYIGIDTPESGCLADEATEKNKELVEGKEVRLEKDVSETDQYHRLLRYVYVDNLFVNDYLVRQGYAQTATYPPDVKYQELFREAEQEARENDRGLWAEDICPGG